MTLVASNVSKLDAVELYRRMLRIRRFEERTAELYAAGAIPGFVHVSVGQEATAVGACWPLRDTDGIVSNHRGRGGWGLPAARTGRRGRVFRGWCDRTRHLP